VPPPHFRKPAIVAGLKSVEEIIDLEDGFRFVIPARLGGLAREESRIAGPFARQPCARVTNPECARPTIYIAHFKLRT